MNFAIVHPTCMAGDLTLNCASDIRAAGLFDHLVGAGKQRRRHGEIEQPGGL
jgi:hypothetical protein